jgi:hypothetical protein
MKKQFPVLFDKNGKKITVRRLASFSPLYRSRDRIARLTSYTNVRQLTKKKIARRFFLWEVKAGISRKYHSIESFVFLKRKSVSFLPFYILFYSDLGECALHYRCNDNLGTMVKVVPQ